MAVDVERWLASKGLSRYLEKFIDNGFDDLESVQNLDREDLDAIGVADSRHRDVLLGRIAPLAASNPRRHSAADRGRDPAVPAKKKSQVMEVDPFDQFEAIFQDIDNMIGDIRSFQTSEGVANGFDSQSDHSNHSSVSKEIKPMPQQATFELETSDQHDPESSLELEFNPASHPDEAEESSFSAQASSTVVLGVSAKQANTSDDNLDLDSILNDLMSFDPSKAVAQAQQRQVPPIENGHLAHQEASPPPLLPRGQPHPPPSQPRPTAVPSSTAVRPVDSFQLPTSLTEDKSKSEKPALTRKLSTVNRMNAVPAGASTDEGKTVLIKSTSMLHSASEQISSSDIKQRLDKFVTDLQCDASLTEEERDLKVKEEKMRIALEKMKLANKKKVVIKVFTEDGASKAVVVDEDMTAAMVSHLLAVKNHWEEGPHWQLVERLGDLSAERVLEDHENVVDVHNSWPRDNKNVFIFRKNRKKYDLMEHPLNFFPDLGSSAKDVDPKKKAERAKKIMMQEYFSESGRVPEVEGVLYMKEGLKKPWKKYFFMLRASGLYHSTKGRSKAIKHLVKFVTFDDHDLYTGVNFKKLLGAPSQYCFCLRPSRAAVATKDVKVFCAENKDRLKMWMAGVRMAKYGVQLYNDYRAAFVTQFKLAEPELSDGGQGVPKAPSESLNGKVGSPTPVAASPPEPPVRSHHIAPAPTPVAANHAPAPRSQPVMAAPPLAPQQPKPVVDPQPPGQQHVVLSRPPLSPTSSQTAMPVPAFEPPQVKPGPPATFSPQFNPPVPTMQQHQPPQKQPSAKAPPPTAPKPQKPVIQSPDNKKRPPPPPMRGNSHLSPIQKTPDATVVPPQRNGNISAEVTESNRSSSPPRETRVASPPVRSAGGPLMVPTKLKPQPPTPAPRPLAFPTTVQPPQPADQPPPPTVQEPHPYVQPVPTASAQLGIQPPLPIVRPKPRFTPSGQGVKVMPSNNMATSPTASTPLLSTDGVPLQDQPVPPLPRSPSTVQSAPAPQMSRAPPEIPKPYKSTVSREQSPPNGPSVQAPLPPATPPKHRQMAEPPHLPPAKHHYPNPNATPQQIIAASQREWFHGKITRDEAQKRIVNLGQCNGVFLVRESTTVSGCYVLTMYAYGTFRNFQIQKVVVGMGVEKFFIDDGPQFPSLELLLAHYHSDADRMPCALTRFVPRSQFSFV